MSNFIEQHVAEMTEWYCHLVKQPGWREYVEDRVGYMAAKQPKLYGSLPSRLEEAISGMTAAGEQSTSQPSSPSTRAPSRPAGPNSRRMG